MNIPQILASDSYKQFHYKMYPKGITKLYSNLTPRKHLIKTDKSVFFGLQYYIKEYLINQWNDTFFKRPLDEVITEYKRFHKYFSMVDDIDSQHIIDLHKLGYLPLEIKALPEGSKVSPKVPYFTIQNTHPNFAWLTNFVETQVSTVVRDLCVIATYGNMFYEKIKSWNEKTVGNTDFVKFQCHDFSMRGRSSMESAQNQAGWLLSFVGTDTIPAVLMLEKYYNANIEKELVGTSVPATEHSVMTSYGKEKEIDAFKRILEQFPEGIVSIVSDSFDLWKVCTEYMKEMKEEILSRNGKVVLRPDSGNPVDIICGGNIEKKDVDTMEEFLSVAQEILHDELCEITPHGEYGGDIDDFFYWKDDLYKVKYSPDWNRYDKQYYFIDNYGSNKTKAVKVEIEPKHKGVVELLWDVFGGTINEKGYKVLHPNIGTIYGDSITLERMDEICSRLESKGFASSNVVFGVGSYTMNYNTRDTLGIAMKATYCEVDGEKREIFKDPITDNGTKKSAKGLLKVVKENGEFVLYDQVSEQEEREGELKTVFLNGKIVKDWTLSEIRNNLGNI